MRLAGLATLLLPLLACALPPPATSPAAGVAPHAGLGSAEACPQWTACRRVAGPADVSGDETAYSPEVAWDSDELLVLYRSPTRSDLRAPLTHVLATVGLDGGVRRRARVVSSRWAKLTWSPTAGAGLVVSDVGLTWLARDGRAMAAVTPVPAGVEAALPVEATGGFVVLATLAGGAVIGRADAEPGAVPWRVLGEPGKRAAPVRTRAASGHATWMAAPREGGAVDLFRVAPDGALGTRMRASIPETATLLALAEDGESVVAVVAEPRARELALVMLVPQAAQASAPRRLDARASRSGVADVVRVGSTLVLGTDQIGAGAGVAAAALDAGGSLGAPMQIGEAGSEGLRFAATPRGFAAAWTRTAGGAPDHGSSAMLAVYDCCPR